MAVRLSLAQAMHGRLWASTGPHRVVQCLGRPFSAGPQGSAWLDQAQRHDVLQQFAAEQDAFKPSYPTAMWDRLLMSVPEVDLSTSDDSNPHQAVDICCGSRGWAAIALASRGWSVRAVDKDSQALEDAQKAFQKADLAQNISTVLTRAEEMVSGGHIQPQSASLVTALQSFHWVDMDPVLRQAAEVLVPGGILAVIWNDRNIECKWVHEWEALMEKFNPKYKGLGRQTDRFFHEHQSPHLVLSEDFVASTPPTPRWWKPQSSLAPEHLFELVEQSNHDNIMVFDSIQQLVDLSLAFSFMQSGIEDQRRAEFAEEIRQMLRKHHPIDDRGQEPSVTLPWVSRLYLLARLRQDG